MDGGDSRGKKAKKNPFDIKSRLAQHIARQNNNAGSIEQQLAEVEVEYQQTGTPLKNILKKYLSKSISMPDGKIVITMVGIQNDFVLKGFGYYTQGAENTVYSNTALLEAILELIKDSPGVASCIEIVIVQVAHFLGRKKASPDAKIMSRRYGQEVTKEILSQEQAELNSGIGLYAIVGTIGAAIPPSIELLLNKLSQKITINYFASMTCSGVQAGLKLGEGVALSDKAHLSPGQGIYDKKGITYTDFFTEKNYSKNVITGIHGNIFVPVTAQALRTLTDKVEVLDLCVHYLIPKNLTFKEVRTSVWAKFDEYGIDYATCPTKGFRSNPDLLGYEGATAFYKDSKLEQALERFYQHDNYQAGENNSRESMVIHTLCEQLKNLIKFFLSKDSRKSFALRLTNFKHDSLLSIKEAKDSLPEPSEWQKLLAALASFIVSICSFGIANYISGRGMFTLFPPKTATRIKIDEIESALSLELAKV